MVCCSVLYYKYHNILQYMTARVICTVEYSNISKYCKINSEGRRKHCLNDLDFSYVPQSHSRTLALSHSHVSLAARLWTGARCGVRAEAALHGAFRAFEESRTDARRTGSRAAGPPAVAPVRHTALEPRRGASSFIIQYT